MAKGAGDAEQGWLLLVHQLPPQPTRLRVRVWRRLQRLGAVAVKNSVWVLPLNDRSREDFGWLAQEIAAAGGEAAVFAARAVAGTSDAEIVAAFRAERDAAYAALGRELEAVRRGVGGRPAAAELERATTELERLAAELETIMAIDYFDAAGGKQARGALARAREALRRAQGERRGTGPVRGAGRLDPADFQGKRWVTRPRPHIDRLASSWLIRRFVDPRARFAFSAPEAVPAGAIAFDMPGVDLGHQGEASTFETLVARFGLGGDPGLRALAEIVHDLDLRDGKFQRPEAAGVEALVCGLAERVSDDGKLLRAAWPLFDALHAALRGGEPAAKKTPRRRAAGKRDGRRRRG
jgi:hypothetical protein